MSEILIYEKVIKNSLVKGITLNPPIRKDDKWSVDWYLVELHANHRPVHLDGV